MAYKLKSSIDSLCGSPAYNLSGKKGLQPSNNPAAAYMTGSPVNNLGHGRKGFHVHLGSTSDDTISTPIPPVEPLSAEEKAYFDTRNTPTKEERLEKERLDKEAQTTIQPAPKQPKTVKVKKKEEVAASGSSSAQTKAKEREKRALTALSKRKTTPRTKDGVEAVRNHNANKKKKASEPKEMSRKQIRAAKQEDKLAGMSRKQVRANKLKRKADSAKAKTNKTIKP